MVIIIIYLIFLIKFFFLNNILESSSSNNNNIIRGFSLDSLLKLNSAKAFDKKTSILQYIIVIIQR